MKIEIEFEDVAAMQKGLIASEKEIKELKEKINSLDETKLKKDAVDLSKRMCKDILLRIFKELGFKDSNLMSFTFEFQNLEHYLGKSWWGSEKMKVTFGASVNTEFREAFLRLGIKPQE